MTKYLVKMTLTATADNPNFAGETKVFYYGKDQRGTDDIKDFEIFSWKTGWSHRRWAEQYIEKDKRFYEEHPEYWEHDWEVVTYEE